MAYTSKASLAAAATTSNNTHDSIKVTSKAALLALEFVIEVAGGSPTVTYKLQGTFDPATTVDGSANFFDLMLLPAESETAAATFTKTAVGAYVAYLAQSHVRFVTRIRLVTSSNTAITYRANLRTQVRG